MLMSKKLEFNSFSLFWCYCNLIKITSFQGSISTAVLWKEKNNTATAVDTNVLRYFFFLKVRDFSFLKVISNIEM